MNKFIFLSLIVTSCVSVRVGEKLRSEDLDELVGKTITVSGKSVNAFLGARIEINDSLVIWMDDMEMWPDDYYQGDDDCKTVLVTVKLI